MPTQSCRIDFELSENIVAAITNLQIEILNTSLEILEAIAEDNPDTTMSLLEVQGIVDGLCNEVIGYFLVTQKYIKENLIRMIKKKVEEDGADA